MLHATGYCVAAGNRVTIIISEFRSSSKWEGGGGGCLA